MPDSIILAPKKRFELWPVVCGERLRLSFHKSFQQYVELFHAPAAHPPEASQARGLVQFSADHTPLRAIIIFLISAMALAGFKPLGQVRVQFMMVWQR